MENTKNNHINKMACVNYLNSQNKIDKPYMR